MKIKDIALSAAYVGQRVVKAICVGAQEVWSAIKYIVFKDKVVEQICVANFSSDGVGVSEEDAAKVTDIGTIFKGNTEITSFGELAEFDNVTEVKANAFNGCTSLASVDMSNIRKIGDYAFVDTNISGDLAMPNLEEFSRYSVFKNCPNLISISNFGKITEFNSWTDAKQFVNCGLRFLTFPPTLKKINNLVYTSNGFGTLIESVNLEHIEYLGDRVFHSCKNLEVPLIAPKLTHVGAGCFQYTMLTKIECENIEDIGVAAFANCVNLKGELYFPKLKTIGTNAFYGASGITHIRSLGEVVTIPDGDGCFRGVNTIEFIVLPSSIEYVGTRCFTSTALKTLIVYATTPPTLGVNAISSAISNGSIYVPDQSVTAYREASGWLSYADQIKPLSQYVES